MKGYEPVDIDKLKISNNIHKKHIDYKSFLAILLKYSPDKTVHFNDCYFDVEFDLFYSFTNQYTYIVESIIFDDCTFKKLEIRTPNPIYLSTQIQFNRCISSELVTLHKLNQSNNSVSTNSPFVSIFSCDFYGLLIDDINSYNLNIEINDSTIDNLLSIDLCNTNKVHFNDSILKGNLRITNNCVNDLILNKSHIERKDILIQNNSLKVLKIDCIFNEIRRLSINNNSIFNTLDLSNSYFRNFKSSIELIRNNTILNIGYKEDFNDFLNMLKLIKIDKSIENNHFINYYFIQYENLVNDYMKELFVTTAEKYFKKSFKAYNSNFSIYELRDFLSEIKKKKCSIIKMKNKKDNYLFKEFLSNLINDINEIEQLKESCVDLQNHINLIEEDKEMVNDYIKNNVSYRFNSKSVKNYEKIHCTFNCFNTNFSDITIKYSQNIFSKVSIDKAIITNVEFFSFEEIKKWYNLSFLNKYYPNVSQTIGKELNTLAKIFLKQNNNKKDGLKLSYFAYHYQHSGVPHFINGVLTGYMLKPVRFLVWMLVIVILFSFLYFHYGISGPATNFMNSKLLQSLYFSIVTFSTLGLGDLSPSHTSSSVFTAIEGALGAIMMAGLFSIIMNRVNH